MKRPVANAADLVNRVLGGRYRVEEALGSGGMGHVFRATQIDLGRRVALKILSDVPSEVDLARFEREARTAAGLGHPHIVQVTDFQAKGDDPPFLVMELLEGSSLGAVVRRGHPLDQRRVVRIGLQVLSALGAAHRAGLVHRDVKPENIVLVASPAGDLAKVVDFGLAKEVEPSPTDVPVSRLGAVVGTPAFMSPEQARGEKLDGRADLYGVAATLYYALTAHFPIEAPERERQIDAILTYAPTPIVTYRADVDRRLAAIVMRGLEKDRGRRFQTAEEMITALEHWLAGDAMPSTKSMTEATQRDDEVASTLVSPKVESSRPRPRRRNRNVAIFAASSGIVLLTGLAAGAYFLSTADKKAPVPPTASASSAPPEAKEEEDASATIVVATAEAETSSPVDAAPLVTKPRPVTSASARRPSVTTPASPPTPVAGQPLGQACVSSGDCGAHQTCVESACTCSRYWSPCGSACVDLRSDGENCGTCGNACARDALCNDGTCKACSKYWPGQPTTACDKPHICVLLDTSHNHCGGCGKACAPNETCWRGRCGPK